MKLSFSPIKVVILIILVYFLLIGLANILITSNKDTLLEQLKSFGVYARVERVIITPGLLVRVENVEISNSDFRATLGDAKLLIDIRKLVLGRIPINYLYTSNVVIQLLSINPSNITRTNEFERRYIYDALNLLQRSKFKFNDTTIITEGVRIGMNDVSINVINGSIIFDVLT